MGLLDTPTREGREQDIMAKKGNEYAAQLVGMNASKNVFMAIAYSLAMRLTEDDHERAAELVQAEWHSLHDAGIVPQRPR
jgi:hypothetical protein